MECTTILLICNEKDNIEPLTRDVLDVYSQNGIDGEVLLLDDGSTDGSSEICDRLSETEERVRCVHHGVNRGRSYAIRTGFQEAKGDVAIIMDGDRQYEPKEIPLFLNKIRRGTMLSRMAPSAASLHQEVHLPRIQQVHHTEKVRSGHKGPEQRVQGVRPYKAVSMADTKATRPAPIHIAAGKPAWNEDDSPSH